MPDLGLGLDFTFASSIHINILNHWANLDIRRTDCKASSLKSFETPVDLQSCLRATELLACANQSINQCVLTADDVWHGNELVIYYRGLGQQNQCR